MNKFRSRAMAVYATLVFCVHFLFPWAAFAQQSPSGGSSFDGTASAGFMQTTSTAVAPTPIVPEANIQGAPLPAKATISPDMAAAISNGITNSGNMVIDFGTLPGGVLDHGGNNFTNTGNIYAISTNPAITTATLQAQNIYNQAGATITTIVPTGILAQYTNLVSNLNLTLNAVQSVVNAGTISSAGNLTVNAGTSIINALPTNLAASMPPPVMQAMNNVNLNTTNIANAGLIQSMTSNINVATTALAATQNIVFNNVGGTLSALQGAVNVRDASFVGKVNTSILGGDVLSRELNLYTGNGLLDVQLNNMTGDLTIRAGDGYVSALSDIHVANVLFSGDPIVKSGNNIVFESDKDPITGQKTGICTGGGQFSGTDALIAGDVQTISISGAILDLSGSAFLGTLPISSASSLVINAAGNINVSSVGAGSAIILKSSGGSVNAGTLSAGDFIQLEAPGGNVNSGDLSSQAGGVRVVAQDIHVGAISAINRPGFVDIKAQTAAPFIVGTSSDPMAPPPNIRSITMTGSSPTGNAWVNIDNPNGVTINSASAVTISTAPSTFSGLSINAQNGTVTLPSGNMIFRGGNFAVSANSIVANGTTIDTSSTAGPGGLIFLGATIVDRGAGGLTLNTDGTNNLGSGIGIGGKQSVAIVTQFDGVNNSRFVNYSGTVAAPFSLSGSGSLTATSKGTVNGGNIFVDSLSTATLSGGAMTLNADGVGNGNGGFVQMFNSQIVNNVSSTQGIKLSANGSGNGNGGFAQAVANSSGANLTLRPGTLTLSATSGGGSGGNGGTIDTKAGGTLFVDPAAISTGAVGLQGNGQRLTMVGGTTGQAGGGIVFTKGGTFVNEGKGSGFGGLVQIGAFGTDNNLRYSAQVGAQTELVNVSVQGGLTGSGGTIQSDAGRNMVVDGSSLRASAGTSGNGNGGLIDLKSGKSGIGTMTVTGGNMEANASGSGTGGFIRMVNFGQGLSIDPGTNPSIELKATGVRGDGGTVVLQSYGDVTLNNTAIDVQGGKSGNGNGGFVEIDSGFSGTGNLNATTSIIADGGGTGNGGTIIANSLAGNATFNHPGDTTVMSVQGGEGGTSGNGGFIRVLAAKDLNLQSGDVEASSLAANGNGGTIILGAGTSSAGRLIYNQKIHANGGTVSGNGGQIFLSEASNQSLLISGDIQADALTDGVSGHVSYQNFSSSPLFVEVSGNVSAISATGPIGTSFFDATATGQNINVHVLGTGELKGGVSTNGRDVNIQVDASTRTPITRLEIVEIANTGSTVINLPTQSSEIVLASGTNSIKSSGNITLQARTIENNGSVVALNAGSSIILQNGSGLGSLDLKGSGTYSAAAAAGLNFIDGKVGSGQELRVAGNLTFEGNSIRLGGHDAKVTFQSELDVTGDLELTGSKITLSPTADVNVDGKANFFTANITNEGLMQVTQDVQIRPDVITPGQYTVNLAGDGELLSAGTMRIFKNLDTNGQRTAIDELHIFGSVFLDADAIEIRSISTTIERGSLWRLGGPNGAAIPISILSTVNQGRFSMLGDNTELSAQGDLTLDMGINGQIHIGEVGFRAATPDLHANSLNIRASDIFNGGLIRSSTGDVTIQNPALQTASGNVGISNLAPDQPGHIIAGTGGSRNLFINSSASVVARQGSFRGVLHGSTFRDFTVVSESGLALGNILAEEGGIFISTIHDGIRLTSGSTLVSSPAGLDPSVFGEAGRVILHALDTATGSIVLENNTSVFASRTYDKGGLDNIVVSFTVGPLNSLQHPPSDPITPPANFTVGTYPGFLNRGHVFFGQSGIAGSGQILTGGTNPASSAGGLVVFETNGLLPAAITVGGSTIVGVLHGGPTDLAVLPPGANHIGPPGQNGTSPGLSGATPGQSGASPPGQVFIAPGQLKHVSAVSTVTTSPMLPAAQEVHGGAQAVKETSVKKASSENGEQSESRFRAVAFVVDAPRITHLGIFETENANLFAPSDCVLGQLNDEQFELLQGEVLVDAKHPSTIQCNDTTVAIGSKSIVLLIAEEGGLRIYDLVDAHQSKVSVTVSGRKFHLMPGQELAIKTHAHDFADGIARRRSEHAVLEEAHTCISDVSLVSLASANRTLREVLIDKKTGSAIRNKIQKMAACLMLSTPQRGPYSAQ